MKRKIIISLALVTALFIDCKNEPAVEYAVEPYASAVKPEEMTLITRWLGFLTKNGAEADAARYAPAIPFSFVCGERSSTEWIQPDNANIESGGWINHTRIHTLRWKDGRTKLSCEMQLTEYRDFPAMSWTVFLKNEGAADTDPVHDFKALDTYWKCADESMPVLYRSQGSDSRTDDFVYTGEEMRKSLWVNSRTVRMDSKTNSDFRRALNNSLFDSDTRPSATWLPFFNLQTGDDGLIVGIGWNGLWYAEIGHDGNGACPLSAGMEHLNTKLLPGESIRSPLMLVVYWSGESMHGQNMFRQLVLNHFHPQKDGKPLQMPVCCSTWGGWPNQTHLEFIQTIAEKKLPYDYYWIDAGWYGKSETDCPNVFNGDWGTVGDWMVNKHRHPETLKPISDAVHKANMKFLLWFEPVRTTRGTGAATAHPEWFVDTGGDNLLLDLGKPEAKKYITETVSGLIAENRIDCYREDFNFDPFPYWTHREEPNRAGMREMRFVEGVYAYWDELLRRRPDMVIDNCASGGRRIELETMKRSMPLWRTDYNCFPYLLTEATQAHTFGMAHWLPANSTSPFVGKPDTYQFRSALSSGVVASLDDLGVRPIAERTDEEWDWWRIRIEEAQRAKPFFYGDFYPLTNGNYSLENWLAYHFYLPEQKSGLIVAFRRPKSDVVSMTFDLTTIR
ncbi:MAG: alpha-galactosidase, partial [Bacteroidales bacterium]|nr:alpha-galactosidase [Bacteroidales bacterium]